MNNVTEYGVKMSFVVVISLTDYIAYVTEYGVKMSFCCSGLFD